MTQVSPGPTRQELFHFYFQTSHNLEPQRYRGIADLDALPAHFSRVLKHVREQHNSGLENTKIRTPNHLIHSPVYFDYVDSDAENAIAFAFGGFSFIGVTIPLAESMFRRSMALGHSGLVLFETGMLGREQSDDTNSSERVAGITFWLQMGFVVTHEYAHILHGDVARSTSGFGDEPRGVLGGSIRRQAYEANADSFSTHVTLAYMFEHPPGREYLVTSLGVQHVAAPEQDELLLQCFVLAVACVICSPPFDVSDTVPADRLTHPPSVVRMNFTMHAFWNWARQVRPALFEWMDTARFLRSISLVYLALWGDAGESRLRQELQFLQTEEGKTYQDSVEKAYRTHLVRLGY